MIESAKGKAQTETNADRALTDLSELQLALVGGGSGDVLWG